MTLDALTKLLIQRKQAAEQERIAFVERLGISEGVALACQWVLDELAKPDEGAHAE